MHIIGLASSTDIELNQGRDNLIKFMNDKCEGGQVREWRIWEVIFDEKYENAIVESLPRPHGNLAYSVNKILSMPFIGKFLDKFLKGRMVRRVHDVRKDTKHHGPEFTMLAMKRDGHYADGKEVL